MDVKTLQAIGALKWARSDGVVRGGMHVEPPKELGTGQLGIFPTKSLPQFFPFYQTIGLFPEMVFIECAIIPSIRYNAMVGRHRSGQVGCLSGTSYCGQDGLDGHQGVILAFGESL